MTAGEHQDVCPEVRLIPAAEADRAAVERMFVFYIYDMSAYFQGPCAVDGHATPCPWLPLYWTEPERHAMLIDVAGQTAGFVLFRALDDGPQPHHELAEFYVMPRFRRRGVGRAAARQAFEMKRGHWRVAQLPSNLPGIAFWQSVIAAVPTYWSQQATELKDGVGINVMRFRAR